jgi:hypothetical protein
MLGTTLSNEQLMVGGTGSRGIGVSTTTSGDPFVRLYDNTTIKADMWWDRTGGYMGINSIGSGSKTAINPFGGNVGIGTTAPLTTFTVKSTNDNGYALTRPSDASSLHWRLSTTESGGDAYTVRYNTFNNEMLFTTYTSGGTGGNIIFRTGSSGGGSETTRMTISPTGLIFMNNLGGYSASYADVRYDTSSKELYYQTSSKRYKTDIVDIENVLGKVNQLRPVRYKDIKSQGNNCGLIAEEVVEIIPDVVFKKQIDGFDQPQCEGINYSDFVPFLIKAIQEQQSQIESLKKQIA